MSGFIKLNRSKESLELTKDANAFTLLSIIAIRAKRTNDFSIYNLKMGEALIGDYKSSGLSRQNYRTSLKKLENWEFLTIQPTNKGTIVTLLEGRIYDINLDAGNHPANHQPTISQPSANHPLTTNKKYKKEKKLKEDIYVQSFNEFWIKYPKKKGKYSTAKAWDKMTEPEQILALNSIDKQRENIISGGMQYCPLGSTWLNGKRWEDEAQNQDDRFNFPDRKEYLHAKK